MSALGTDPRVSVVIPVRDGERYLGEAIESALGQTMPPLEVIVVDNGSSDGSAELAATFGAPVRVLDCPEGGASGARNLGVGRARGEILAFIDADDRCEPDRLATQVPHLLEPGGPDLVFGHLREFHSPELSDAERSGLAEPRGVIPGRFSGTLVAERATFNRVGPFDTSLPAACFVDWLSRARALGLGELMLDDVVSRRRIHLHNTRWDTRPQDLTRALRAAVHRQRASG